MPEARDTVTGDIARALPGATAAQARTGAPASGDPATDAAQGALVVAIVGAESTGKSRLAQALAARLAGEFGLRPACIGEYLREWCEAEGRTPRPDEQAAIALEQQRRADEAAARPDIDIVLCDTTPLMTTVYSELLFDDRTLDGFAAACQRRAHATLLTALDLPWIADGLMRDGPHVREPVDALVRARLRQWGVAWSLVAGTGDARTDAALDALRPTLLRRAASSGAGAGLFRRALAARHGPPRPRWVCERCDDPACEHLARGTGPG
ncbi:MAG: AAA family ATPase [Burkholderiaceae bacterium]